MQKRRNSIANTLELRLYYTNPLIYLLMSLAIALLLSLTHWDRDRMAAILQTMFSNAFSWMKMLLNISLKFVPNGPVNNIPSLVQVMAWRRPGDKPLSEPMMVSLLTHRSVTRPQWVNICYCSSLLILSMLSSVLSVSLMLFARSGLGCNSTC